MSNPFFSKSNKWILLIAFLLLLSGGAWWYLRNSLNFSNKPDVKRYLNKLVVDGSDSLYNLKMSDYEVAEGINGGFFNDVEVTINQPVFEKMRANGTLPEVIYEGKADKLIIENIDLLSLVQDRKDIIIDKIKLDGATLNIYQYKRIKKDSTKPAATRYLFDRIKPDINSIVIKKIDVQDSKIRFDPSGKMDSKKAFWKFEDADFVVTDFIIDSTSSMDSSRFLYSKDFTMSMKDFKSVTSDNLYKLGVGKIDFHSAGDLMEITNFSYLPNVSNEVFYKTKKFAAGKPSIEIPLMILKGFKSLDLVMQNKLIADHITVKNGQFNILKDKRFGDPPRSKNGQYPNQVIRKLGIDLQLKKISLVNADVIYTERSLKTGKEGKLTFEKINGTLTNVTNNALALSKNKTMELKAKTIFMGRSPLDAHMTFDQSNNRGNYTADAILTNFDGEQINPLIKNLGMAETRSLKLKKLIYNSLGNEKTATGSMTMHYTDLKIDIFKQDEESGKAENKKLLSFLANLMKVRENNPDRSGEDHKAKNITSTRPYFKGFFTLIWYNVFDCIQDIAIKGEAPEILKKGRKLSEQNKRK